MLRMIVDYVFEEEIRGTMCVWVIFFEENKREMSE